MDNQSKSFQFEQALDELEQIVQRLETEDLSLEQALGCFEQGVKLTKQCQTTLKTAEQKIEQVSSQLNTDSAASSDHPNEE